jgi:hypothetical protein
LTTNTATIASHSTIHSPMFWMNCHELKTEPMSVPPEPPPPAAAGW